MLIRRPELAWLGTETNQFGTDEFLEWCEALGTEPYFALNFGTGASILNVVAVGGEADPRI